MCKTILILPDIMKNDLFIKLGVIIPEHELEISTSRSGGPGGQHVNKADTRVTVRWNIKNSAALTPEQKARVLDKLSSRITAESDLLVHSSQSRSQLQNKKIACEQLAQEIRQALFIAKKRKPTKITKSIKEARKQTKFRRSEVKKMRKSPVY